jgi:2-polyprenyl-3-methyl-5-hydroxy-6-metoxy-1,4-benzoquinol methylase
VLIAGEVLEHLVDPWVALKRLRRFLRPDGLAMASSPNVAHHSTIRMLLKGEWTLANSGRMDRAHLRWFTPKSYAEMFRACAFEVVSTEPLSELGPRAKLANRLTAGRLEHLFIGQIVVVAKNAASSKSG